MSSAACSLCTAGSYSTGSGGICVVRPIALVRPTLFIVCGPVCNNSQNMLFLQALRVLRRAACVWPGRTRRGQVMIMLRKSEAVLSLMRYVEFRQSVQRSLPLRV
jgi:hypothetical protein